MKIKICFSFPGCNQALKHQHHDNLNSFDIKPEGGGGGWGGAQMQQWAYNWGGGGCL